MGLFEELKRRNVIRVALFYIVSAWVILQVAETVLPLFDVADSVLRAIVLVLALGFVPALLFSWVFELTPDGLRRETDDRVNDAIRHQGARKLNWATLVVALIAIGLLIADRIVPEAPAPAPVAAAATPADEPPDGAAVASRGPEPASIAVLPFDDLSPDGDQGYFSDGIAEEILNVLVRIEGLAVASRTSAFRYRGRDDIGIPGIARELEVRHVLEGSVRKAGDTIRITAQLIDGVTDRHLWSETYDRSLSVENIFAIQDEIASAIVDALRGSITLPGPEPHVSARTDSLDAYELYLEARGYFNARDRLDVADALLARAVELDPGFSEAWAIRAAIYMVSEEYGDIEISRAESSRLAEQYAGAALAADPDNGLGLSVLAYNRAIDSRGGRARHPVAGVVAGLRRAVELDPKNSSARNWLGISYGETGELEAALAQFRQCIEDDPFYAPCVENHYDTLVSLGRMDEALEAYLDALDSGTGTDEWASLSLLAHFRLETHFLYVTNQSRYLPGWPRHRAIWAAWQDLQADHSELARELRAHADRIRDKSVGTSNAVNVIAPLGGSFDLVPFSILIWGPDFARYRGSPEFRQRMLDQSIPAYWREHGFPPQCRPVGEADFACD